MRRLDSTRSASRAAAHEVAQDANACVARLLGVELHAEDVAALDRRRERGAVLAGRRRTRRSPGAAIRVREVDLRAFGDAVEQPRGLRCVAASSSRRAAPSPGSRGSREHRPGDHAEARRRPAPRRCPRTATACRGRCRAAACRRSTASRMAAATRPRARASRAKLPTPGTTMPRRACQIRRLGRREQLCADGGEALANGGQIAGAVVDERDHSSPFVLGQHPRQRRSRAQATRSARANALKTASTW